MIYMEFYRPWAAIFDKLSIFGYFRAKIEAMQVQYDDTIELDQLTFDWSH